MSDANEKEEGKEEVVNPESDIEVVNGDGSELDVSPVYDHLNVAKPKPKDENQKIIIPEIKEKKES